MLKASDTLNTTYLRFDAFSIRDAIIQRLSEDQYFTDQLYAGSNLSIIIDLVSVMFQAAMYNLNSAASETMFADTQIYENINRLVKILNYNPRGYSTSVLTVNLTVPFDQGCTIPRFAYIDTGLKDSQSRPIYFSLITDREVQDNITRDGEQTGNELVTVYNGKWKLSSKVYVSRGLPFEVFDLVDLSSNSDENKYVAYPHIMVYVKHTTDDGEIQWQQYRRVSNIFTNGSSIYTKDDAIFELRLTAYKTYEITFGNGVYGKRLSNNDEVYVFYLDSNGPDGKIDPGVINNRPIQFSASGLGISQDMFNAIFPEVDTATLQKLKNITASNINASSTPSAEEDVESIRMNAPATFITGGRLVTTQDVENWVKREYVGHVYDAIVMNNWKYITEFYGWLYNMGMKNSGNGQMYITPSILQKYDLNYTDAADSNTMYIWIKTAANSELPTDLPTRIESIKPLTSNVVTVPALNVNFSICVADEDYVKQNYLGAGVVFDQDHENYLEVTVEDDLRYSPILIKNTIKNTIRSFFADTNFKLGQVVNLNDLYENLISISGVTRIRTIFAPKDEAIKSTAKTGICFATWSPDVITPGDDLEISSIQRKLESFQFPALANSDLDSVIKIITKNSNFSTIY